MKNKYDTVKMGLIIGYLMDQLNLKEVTITEPMIEAMMKKYGKDTELSIASNKKDKIIKVTINGGE